MKKLCVVLPAFNEEVVISQVLTSVKKELKKLPGWQAQLVVVDDGSHDRTGQVARKAGAIVLRHVLNRGLGGAISTGMGYAKKINADILVTIDSDGQHDPEDIKKVIGPILEGRADVVIGSRLFDRKKMPLDRLIISWGGSILTFFLFRIWTTDSQSGFRAFNRKAMQAIQVKTQGMEVSSELFGEIKRNRLRLTEVPIKVIYTEYSRQKGQNNLNAPRVVLKLILRLFR